MKFQKNTICLSGAIILTIITLYLLLPTNFYKNIFYDKNSDVACIQIQTIVDDAESNLIEEMPQPDEEHHFKQLPTKIFTSVQERKKLFEELGIVHLDNIIISYDKILTADPKDTEKYRTFPEHFQNTLHDTYADDIASHKLTPMSLRWISKDIGYGLFTEIDLQAKDFIGEYTGEIMQRDLVEDKDYAWSYPILDTQGQPTILDGKLKGNELRFANDGATPNCQVHYVIGHDNLWHVIYTALTDIPKGEQLLISYGPAYWQTRNYAYQELIKDH